MSEEEVLPEGRDLLYGRLSAALDARAEAIARELIAPLQSQIASLQAEVAELRSLVEKSHR